MAKQNFKAAAGLPVEQEPCALFARCDLVPGHLRLHGGTFAAFAEGGEEVL
jgi:hypothetical protein